jgi:hypothetical protein
MANASKQGLAYAVRVRLTGLGSGELHCCRVTLSTMMPVPEKYNGFLG